MKPASTVAALTFLLVFAALSSAVFGPGPNSTVVPITAPPDNSSVLVPPGTATIEGTCTVGAPPGQAVSVLYAVDVSGSTDLTFMTQNGIPLVDANGNQIAGDPGDNFNADAGDTEAGEILDGEIAGVLALHASIGNASTISVGLEAFATNAAAADVGPQGGIQVFTSPPQNDANGTGGADINEVARTFRSEFSNPSGGSIGKFTAVSQSALGSGTSFKKALQTVNTTMAQFPPASTKIVFFFSDGESNTDGRCVQGACTAELNAAIAAGIKINTFGVGASADGADLQFIATATGGTYTAVLDPSQLATVLPTIPPAGIDRLEVNGVEVPLGPLGNFSTTASCGGLGTRTVTATCFADDPAGTSVSADITLSCDPAPSTTTSTSTSTTESSTTVPSTTVPTTSTSSTSETSTTTSTTSTTAPPVCGNGILDGDEECDDPTNPCCSQTCTFAAPGTTCGASPTQCSVRQCDGAGTCDTNLLPNGTPCDDGDTCTENDRCDTGGVCTGQGGPDSDGDGECDRKEQECGCNAFDAREGCLLPNRLGGPPLNRAGEVLVTFYSPKLSKLKVPTDEACDPVGLCSDDGRCVRGKIRDVCTTNADCAEPPDTCRFIVNWAGISDLQLDFARVDATTLPDFLPVTPGCSRRVDVPVRPTRSTFRLKAEGTLDGRHRKDRDVVRTLH
jgi:von Willebrand factor type A domain-containing protein